MTNKQFILKASALNTLLTSVNGAWMYEEIEPILTSSNIDFTSSLVLNLITEYKHNNDLLHCKLIDTLL